MPVSSPWFVGYDLPLDLTEMTAADLEAAIAAVVGEHIDVEIERRVVCGSSAGVLIAEGGAASVLPLTWLSISGRWS